MAEGTHKPSCRQAGSGQSAGARRSSVGFWRAADALPMHADGRRAPALPAQSRQAIGRSRISPACPQATRAYAWAEIWRTTS